jgi:hypothetical protein
MIMISLAMNTKVMSATMTKTHTVTMAEDMPRTRAVARPARKVVIMCITLKTMRTKD